MVRVRSIVQSYLAAPSSLSLPVVPDSLGVRFLASAKLTAPAARNERCGSAVSGPRLNRKVGAHHRLKTADVLAVKRDRLTKQRVAFDELRRLEDELEQS